MQDIDRDNYRLTDVQPIGGGKIHLRFVNGTWVEVDFAHLIAKGNMFANLADDAYLAQAKVGDYGFWLEWPGELDFGADQLWWWGEPVQAAVPIPPVSADPVGAR
jgi:hypothetical protein